MSAAMMEPADDGATREAAGGIHQVTRGRFRYTSFPVRWDDEGRCAAVALEAADAETGDALEFVIVAPGDVNGCACADCAPHEQYGPPSPRWLREHGLVCDRCTATTRNGRECLNNTEGHESGLCGTHRHLQNPPPQRAHCAGITASGRRCDVSTGHPSGYCGHHKRQRPEAEA
jgi:hypothetical protein